jgi:sec-independent protein translocase protein TatA
MGIGNVGLTEMVIIFVIALVVFGPRRLPEIGRSLGSAMREFRRSLNQIQREIEQANPAESIRDVNTILNPNAEPKPRSTESTPPSTTDSQPD